MIEELVHVPTLDGNNRCDATKGGEILCAKIDQCPKVSCSSGDKHIWIKPDQIHDYLALKLVS